MKKNLLAASLALALGSLSGAATAALTVQDTVHIGQINVLPYYSVQDSYNTLITITNTDTRMLNGAEVGNGKVVKIRFRAAEWSDDALDFQIFLSPADVWTGAFGIVDGKLVLKTSDKSCTLPANLDGQEFTTIRVEGGDVNRLKEGYVEIITMADIPKKLNGEDPADSSIRDNPLWTAVKHKDGVATCGTTVSGLLENSTRDRITPLIDVTTANLTEAEAAAASAQGSWLVPATPSLMSSATVIAVQDSKAFTVPGVAIRGDNTDFAQVQYFRQSNTSSNFGTNDDARLLTADRLFWPEQVAGTVVAGTATAVADLPQLGANYPVFQFDLPDLSTPFDGTSDAVEWRDMIAVQLQKGSVATDYVIASSIQASTDVVLSQPLRRYFYDYAVAPAGTNFNRTIRGVNYLVSGEHQTPYAELTLSNKVEVGAPTFWDREEQTFVSEDDIVVSPQEPGESAKYYLEGEVSVVSIKKRGAADAPTEAIGARLTDVDWSFSQPYTAGWAVLSTTTVEDSGTALKWIANTGNLNLAGNSLGYQLPVVGFTAINIFNSGAGAAGTNYGQVLPLRTLD